MGNASNLESWRGVASATAKASWRDRSELASLFIRPGDTVCDLGAGAQPLKAYLPAGAGYLPVDCVDVIPGTHVADFNDPDFTLPAGPFNVITAMGVFTYIRDLDRFMERLVHECDGKFIVFSHDFWARDSRLRDADPLLELDEGALFFSRYVRDLTAVAIMRRRAIFTGVLGRGEPEPIRRKPATAIAIQHVRPLEYLAVKLFGIKMVPRWLA